MLKKQPLTFQHLLMIAILTVAGLAAQPISPDDVPTRLWLLALVAGVLGTVLARLKSPDSLSHLIAIGTGILVTLALAASRIVMESSDASFWSRFTSVASDIREWYIGAIPGADTETLLIVILLQMVVWLTSYLAAWVLVRRGWLTVALVLPGMLVFGANRIDDTRTPYLAEAFVVLAVMLLARTTYMTRTGGDQRRIGSRSVRYGWTSQVTGVVVGLLAVSVGFSTPPGFAQDTLKPIADVASETYSSAQKSSEDWLAEKLGIAPSSNGDAQSFPRYTAFDDAFTVGGELNLTDQPEVVVRTSGSAPYLAAQSYDEYTGRGWESTVDETFDADGPDGVRYSPELTFQPGQKVPYQAPLGNTREPVDMEVTPLTPSGDTVFTSGMYLTAEERTSVEMSWLQLDQAEFLLREMDLSTIPPDLTGVVSALLNADDLTVSGSGELLYPSDAEDRQTLEDVRSGLEKRFIDVSWTVGDDDRVSSLIVTGQLPMYDDNVSVRRADENENSGPYGVTSLALRTTEQELRNASSGYPAWVTDRYLDLPATVTDRTMQLANDLTADTGNVYDQAKIIESYLRTEIAYDLDVGLPPEDADIVDYVLFESPRGYCEYYASAMTVMMRALGIPAKTVVGYYPADFDVDVNGYLYRQENAHAWTEVYFSGFGWVPFEPTAARPASSLDTDAGTPQLQPTPTPTPAPSTVPATPFAAPPPPVADVPDSPGIVPEDPAGSFGWDWTPILVGAGAAMAGALGLGVLMMSRRSSDMAAGSMYASMLRWGRAGGVRTSPSSTPREFSRRVGRAFPDLARDARDIVDVYESERYGGVAAQSPSLTRAAAALGRIRAGIVRRLVRVRR